MQHKATRNERFGGFSPQSLEFLRQLNLHNNRKWFAEHQPDYLRFVANPFRQLAAGLAPMMQELDTQVWTEPKRTISRIYRDTRFSLNKLPYRPNVWIAFKRNPENWTSMPTYFFELTEKEYFIGMGMYCANAATMRNYRRLIDDDAERFWEIIQPLHKSRSMRLEGECYKRPLPCEYRKEITAWYQCRTFAVVGAFQPNKTLFSPKLTDFIIDKFVLLKPLYDFIWKAVAV
ncbi:hypothetical protein FACS189443_5990 [Planctomycetales bacterium]|nr:hypothetical protein FACS189443_5990 [Planctomycetales bacterium]